MHFIAHYLFNDPKNPNAVVLPRQPAMSPQLEFSNIPQYDPTRKPVNLPVPSMEHMKIHG